LHKGYASPEFIIKSDGKSHSIISGYASVFNTVDNHNDCIEKGAFLSSQSNHVKLLWQHDTTKPIGIIRMMDEDSYGLKVEAEINTKTKDGFDASELIKQGAVCGLSIGFNINSADYNSNGNRVIHDLNLIEISVVTFPANEMAQINQIKQKYVKQCKDTAVKKLAELIKQLRKL